MRRINKHVHWICPQLLLAVGVFVCSCDVALVVSACLVPDNPIADTIAGISMDSLPKLFVFFRSADLARAEEVVQCC